ncbi:family 43 glycosylhydrolase [Gangjinia marincola]
MKTGLLLLFFIYLTSFAQQITINNTLPRKDLNGEIVDAHDGRIILFEDTFYWYGTAYGDSNGFTKANQYQCYSSKDLMSWKHEGSLLKEQPTGVYYRPHVIYNEKTKHYVLWYNWYPTLWDGKFGVAVSKNPTGPFKIVNKDVKMANSAVGVGDFGLFVDNDGTGYISYNTIQDHQVSIEKLSDDYVSSTLENGGIIAKYMEAGAMFKRKNNYYLLTDYTCCFCDEGSGARVYRSTDPMKGFSLTGNINRYPGIFTPVLIDGVKRGTQYATLTKSQKENTFQNIQVHTTSPISLDQLTLYKFTGNKPDNCGDTSIPYVHPDITSPVVELSYHNGKEWITIEDVEQNMERTALQQEIIFSFSEISTTKIRITPLEYTMKDIFLNEIVLSRKTDQISNSVLTAYITLDNIPQKPIIPAQQSYIMALPTTKGEQFIWIGDLWGSASDNIKGHDYQYWSTPLNFNPDGSIQSLEWTDEWSVELKK